MKLRYLLVLLFATICFGQDFTTVTGTIQDSDGTVWVNGTWSAQLNNPTGAVPKFIDNGNTVPTVYGPVSLGGGGTISFPIPNNTAIGPAGTTWVFTFCPYSSAACTQLTPITISGSTYNISTFATANIKAPRFPAVNSLGSYGYGDEEVTPVPNPGGSYYSLSNSCVRVWSGSVWSCYSATAGGGTINPGIAGCVGYFPSTATVISPGCNAAVIMKWSDAANDSITVGTNQVLLQDAASDSIALNGGIAFNINGNEVLQLANVTGFNYAYFLANFAFKFAQADNCPYTFSTEGETALYIDATSGPCTLSLPAVGTNGFPYLAMIKKIDNTSNPITLVPADPGGQQEYIEGQLSYVMTIPQQSLIMVAEPEPPVNWRIFSQSAGVINSSVFPGSDIGAQINAAVAACNLPSCTIEVNQPSGTISTSPNLPVGYTLRFNPQGQYTLATHWLMNHRGVTYQFNGAHFTYTLADGNPSFYVGKQIASVVTVTGTAVTWVSGTQFTNMDIGDELFVDSGSFGANVYNIATVNSPTSMTLTSAGINVTSAHAIAYMNASNAIGSFNGRNVSISDLTVDDFPATAADTGLVIELADGVTVNNYTANNYNAGNCLTLLGAISGNYNAIRCNSSLNGIRLDQNAIGTFWASTSNANRFFGLDLNNGMTTGGHALAINGSYGNLIEGLHAEGNANHTVMLTQQILALGYSSTVIQASNNTIEVGDIERNGDNTIGSADISLLNSSYGNLIYGGIFISVYTGSGSGLGTGIGFFNSGAATNNIIRDTTFLDYSTAYTFNSAASGFAYNVNTVSTVLEPPFYIDGSGNLGAPTVTTPLITLGAIDQQAASNTGGKCTMTTTSCTVTLGHSYTVPICIATYQSGGTVIAGECTVSGTTATVTAASSNTGTWGILVFGDPN